MKFSQESQWGRVGAGFKHPCPVSLYRPRPQTLLEMIIEHSPPPQPPPPTPTRDGFLASLSSLEIVIFFNKTKRLYKSLHLISSQYQRLIIKLYHLTKINHNLYGMCHLSPPLPSPYFLKFMFRHIYTKLNQFFPINFKEGSAGFRFVFHAEV